MMAAPTTTPVVDDEWLAAPAKRSRLRIVLLVLLGVALVFFGGVEVQKRYGTVASASSATTGFPGGGAFPSGFTPGGGSVPGGGTAGAPTGAASTGSGSSTQASIIGTLESVKGDVWTIKDLGGHVHTVTVGSTVRIVKEKAVKASDVANGSTLDVSGTTDATGKVTATTITIR